MPDIARLAVDQKTLECLVLVLGPTRLDQIAGEVGTADHFRIAAIAHGTGKGVLDAHAQQICRHGFGAANAAFADRFQPQGQVRLLRINPETDDMDRPVVPGHGDLHARYQMHAAGFCCLPGFGQTGCAVMVGQRQYAAATGSRPGHQFRWRQVAVRCGGVTVQVKKVHAQNARQRALW